MDRVVVLMSTYNGEKYLNEQIKSILEQKGVNVFLYVRDDGSNDSTKDILKKYKMIGKLDFFLGENIGPAKSFMELINGAPEGEYYAFSDQDDVWEKDKLSTAVGLLKGIKNEGLYYHAMNIVDENLEKYGFYYRNEQYSKSMVNTILYGDEIAGCTMVFNKALLQRIREYKPNFITMHDGWIHRVCLSVGGTIIADRTPYINYRQHQNNVIGMKKGRISDKIKNIKRKNCFFSRLAIEMLNGYSKYMKKKDVEIVRIMANYNRNKLKAIRIVKQSNVSYNLKFLTMMKILLGIY